MRGDAAAAVTVTATLKTLHRRERWGGDGDGVRGRVYLTFTQLAL